MTTIRKTMLGRNGTTLIRSEAKTNSFLLRMIVLCFVLLTLSSMTSRAQVISNTGAVISITSGAVLSGGDVENTSGTISHAGTINLTGNYTNSATTNGNGTYNIAGNLTISAGTFDLGTGTANRTSAGGVLSLALGATLKLGGSSGGITGSNFPANFTTVTLSGTVEFNGTGGQTIPVFNYNNLTASGAPDTSVYKTAGGVLAVSGTLTVASNNTVDMRGFSGSTFGSGSNNLGKIRWSASNAYVAGSGTTEFYGSSAGAVAAGAAYGNLWFSGSGTKTISGSVGATGGTTTFGVTVNNNLTVTGSGTLTITGMDLNNSGAVTNNGTITVN